MIVLQSPIFNSLAPRRSRAPHTREPRVEDFGECRCYKHVGPTGLAIRWFKRFPSRFLKAIQDYLSLPKPIQGFLEKKLFIYYGRQDQSPRFKNTPKPLQSKRDQTYLKLIIVNQTFLAPPPPPPVLSNIKRANHWPVYIYQLGSVQKSARFQ